MSDLYVLCLHPFATQLDRKCYKVGVATVSVAEHCLFFFFIKFEKKYGSSSPFD